MSDLALGSQLAGPVRGGPLLKRVVQAVSRSYARSGVHIEITSETPSVTVPVISSAQVWMLVHAACKPAGCTGWAQGIAADAAQPCLPLKMQHCALLHSSCTHAAVGFLQLLRRIAACHCMIWPLLQRAPCPMLASAPGESKCCSCCRAFLKILPLCTKLFQKERKGSRN